MPAKLLTVAETADRLAVKVGTVRALILTGRLAAERCGIGKRAPFRVTERAIEDYRASRAVVVSGAVVAPASEEIYDDTFR